MSYTAQLPLNVSTRSTYQEIEEFRDFVKQNVKNLLLEEQLNGKMVLIQQKEKHLHLIASGQIKKF